MVETISTLINKIKKFRLLIKIGDLIKKCNKKNQNVIVYLFILTS